METAVLVIDLVNDFVSGVLGSERSASIIPQVKRFLDGLRKKGVLVIYLTDSHLPGIDPEFELWPRHAEQGTEGAEIVDEIIEKTRDLGKSGKAMRNRLKGAAEELQKLKEDFERAKTEALVDFLTGAANRKAFDEKLMAAVSKNNSNGGLLSLLMIDIDHFKLYNDTYGHPQGDKLLKDIAALLLENLRKIDVAARYGGEEFVIISPQTSKEEAYNIAERIRIKTESIVRQGENKKITVSAGIATFPEDADDKDGLVEKTDKALYKAKQRGRNRVCVA